MLADTIEAAVRSMKDPTPKAIDQFIERLIRGKLEDGQLTDCELSLRDIDQICEAFSGILKGVYHERIEYPKISQFSGGNQPAHIGVPESTASEIATADSKTESDENEQIPAVKAPETDAGSPTAEKQTGDSAEDVQTDNNQKESNENPEQKDED